jgi:purine nucleosidase
MSDKERILFDTDIGSDIDDAVALAYLLAQPRCELLGITTVSGEPVKRAMLADALCRAAGKSIPIYPGAADPLIVPQKQTEAPQSAALTRWPHATDFPTGEAVEFLRSTIRKYPGEITLLTVGPLTNIALLFAVDPEIPSLLKGLTLMCGVFTEHLSLRPNVTEWNALLDPHATSIVYRAKPPVHRSIGLDVTTHVTMPAAEVRERFAHRLLQPVLDFAEVWFQRRPQITFHDPLAAAVIFEPDLCQFESGPVTVELDDESQLGRTRWAPDGAQGTHLVATKVDAQRFFEHYFGVFA